MRDCPLVTEEQYLYIPRLALKPPVLVVETEEVSTLVGNPTIFLYITTQVTHSPQFTKLRIYKETTSIDKPLPEQVEPEEPLPEQKEHKKPNLEV